MKNVKFRGKKTNSAAKSQIPQLSVKFRGPWKTVGPIYHHQSITKVSSVIIHIKNSHKKGYVTQRWSFSTAKLHVESSPFEFLSSNEDCCKKAVAYQLKPTIIN